MSISPSLPPVHIFDNNFPSDESEPTQNLTYYTPPRSENSTDSMGSISPPVTEVFMRISTLSPPSTPSPLQASIKKMDTSNHTTQKPHRYTLSYPENHFTLEPISTSVTEINREHYPDVPEESLIISDLNLEELSLDDADKLLNKVLFSHDQTELFLEADSAFFDQLLERGFVPWANYQFHLQCYKYIDLLTPPSNPSVTKMLESPNAENCNSEEKLFLEIRKFIAKKTKTQFCPSRPVTKDELITSLKELIELNKESIPSLTSNGSEIKLLYLPYENKPLITRRSSDGTPHSQSPAVSSPRLLPKEIFSEDTLFRMSNPSIRQRAEEGNSLSPHLDLVGPLHLPPKGSIARYIAAQETPA